MKDEDERTRRRPEMPGTGHRPARPPGAMVDAARAAKLFEAGEKARKAAEIERTIRDFENMAAGLDRQIRADEDRCGIRDTKHAAYPIPALAAARRRDNLLASARELQKKLDLALQERDAAFAELSVMEAAARRAAERRRRTPPAVPPVLRDAPE